MSKYRKAFLNGVTTLLLCEIDFVAIAVISYKFLEKLF